MTEEGGMASTASAQERPADRSIGWSAGRERWWGLVGGVVGSLAGIGSFIVARIFDRASLRELVGSPYPPLLARRSVIALDYYFLAVLAAGFAFLIAAIVLLRTGSYPRTDGFGATLVGAILSMLGGLVLFLRVWALTHG
jgi:hypothetical protein